MREEKRIELLHRVARLYYEEGKKKYDIARKIKLSPTQVGNLLKEAEAEGIVKIRVNLPRYKLLENALQQNFNLKEAIVIPSEKNYAVLAKLLGEAAAEYFERNVKDGSRVCIGGGQTLMNMVEALESRPRKIEIVPTSITTRGPEILHIDSYVLVTRLLIKSDWSVAKAFGVLLLSEKTSVGNDIVKAAAQLEKEHENLRKIPEVEFVYNKMLESKFVFIGANSLSHPASYQTTLTLLKERGLQTRSLEKARIIGDINYSFIDDEGKNMLNAYLGLDTKDLQKIAKEPSKQVILIAGGAFKIDPLRAILSRSEKVCNVLITDESTASAVLKKNVN